VSPVPHAAPTVAEIAHDYAGKLKVMKLNVDEAMNSAGRYPRSGNPHAAAVQKRTGCRADLWEQCRRSRSPRRWNGTSDKFLKIIAGRLDTVETPRFFCARFARNSAMNDLRKLGCALHLGGE